MVWAIRVLDMGDSGVAQKRLSCTKTVGGAQIKDVIPTLFVQGRVAGPHDGDEEFWKREIQRVFDTFQS